MAVASSENETLRSTPRPVLHVIRSMSGTSSSKRRSAQSSAVPRLESDSTNHIAAGTSPASTSTRPKQKLGTLERLRRLARKKERAPQLEFPPSSWQIDETRITFDAENAESSTVPEVEVESADVVPLSPTSPTPLVDDTKEESGGSMEESLVLENGTPEPTSLARKIQSLLYSLPLYSLPATSQTSSSVSASTTPPPDGSFTPPPAPPGTDSRLVSFLSSASIMNGSISKGRESVWAILDRLRAPRSVPPTEADSTADSSSTVREELVGVDDDCSDDDSSVMFYGPLCPDADSEVEIARSEVMSSTDGDIGDSLPEIRIEPASPLDSVFEQKQKQGRWPPPMFGVRDKHESRGGIHDTSKGKGREEIGAAKEVRVWVPSTTKISFEVTWWGYRIYLPPPVLAVLNNTHLEGAKRAAIITTALKWLLDHVPVAVLPPQFRGVVTIVRRLVPLLGYVGSFIAWSWSAVRSFDKGNGVILSATWLLPVALIPGTWYPDASTSSVPDGLLSSDICPDVPPKPPPKTLAK